MSDDTLRAATPAEEKMIRFLSRVVGQTLLKAWDQTPAEFKEDTEGMTLSFLAALAHNMGNLLASAPKDQQLPADDASWLQFIDTTLAMTRQSAIDARQRLIEPNPEEADAFGDPRPMLIPTPKLLM